MRISEICFYILILIPLLAGCTNETSSTGSTDETARKNIIGYVDAETIYAVNVDDRINFVIEKSRAKYGIFYKPSLDDLFFYHYISLKREIKKAGFKQPGEDIDRKEKEELAIKLLLDKLGLVYFRFNEGASVEDIVNEFNLDKPKAPREILKGTIPEWDDALWGTKVGEISEPVINSRDKLAYFFHVQEKGTKDDGTEWIKMTTLFMKIPLASANRILEDKKIDTWNVRINSGLYNALLVYFSGNISEAHSLLNAYLKGKGKRDYFAYYFKARILARHMKYVNDNSLQGEYLSNQKKAIEYCNDAGIKSHLRYEISKAYLESNEHEKALEQLRIALDDLTGDIKLTRDIAEIFEAIGDAEYFTKANAKIELIEEQIREETMSSDRHVKKTSRIQTGDGFLHEDIVELIEEVDEARQIELSLDFTILE